MYQSRRTVLWPSGPRRVRALFEVGEDAYQVAFPVVWVDLRGQGCVVSVRTREGGDGVPARRTINDHLQLGADFVKDRLAAPVREGRVPRRVERGVGHAGRMPRAAMAGA